VERRLAQPALDALKGEEKPLEERVAQACTDKETLAALDEALKANPFDVRPVFRDAPAPVRASGQEPRSGELRLHHLPRRRGRANQGVLHRAYPAWRGRSHWNDPSPTK